MSENRRRTVSARPSRRTEVFSALQGTETMAKDNQARSTDSELPSLLMGTALTMASLILVPALAQRIGLASSLTVAIRAALMKVSNKV